LIQSILTLILSAIFHQAALTIHYHCSTNHLKESRITSPNSILTKLKKTESRKNQETKISYLRKDSLKKQTTMPNTFVKCTLHQS